MLFKVSTDRKKLYHLIQDFAMNSDRPHTSLVPSSEELRSDIVSLAVEGKETKEK